MSYLEVGMYLRKENGIIYKIKKQDEDIIELYKKYNYSLIELEENNYDIDLFWIIKDIVKSSKNLIDLIQIDDIVNGNKVVKINYEEKYLTTNGTHNVYIICETEIKSIVTKEQLKQNEYIVEE